jgi:hypoxanthine phosphoribosyltransferase
MTISVHLKDIPNTISRLVTQIQQRAFNPDHILYIESAGWLLGEELAKQMGCSASGIVAKRKGNRLKQFVAPLFSYFPEELAHQIRRLELGSRIHAQVATRQVSLRAELLTPWKRLIIIDDAVDSGNSLQSVVEFLQSKGFAQSDILTAAITVTSSTPVIKPDVSLYSEVVIFPWSPGSKDWRAYQEIVRKRE